MSYIEVQKARNSPFLITLYDVDGTRYSSSRMGEIVRAALKYIPSTGATAEYADSEESSHGDVFDWSLFASVGQIQIDLGILDLTVGEDLLSELIIYDTTYPEGRVFKRLPIKVLDDALPGDVVDPVERTGAIDSALLTDHSYSGPTSIDTVGQDVVFGDFLYRNPTDKKWYKARANAITTLPSLRMAVATASNGSSCRMLCATGIARNDSWAWTADGTIIELFLSASVAGTLTESVDTASGAFGQVVATPLASNQIQLQPSIIVMRF